MELIRIFLLFRKIYISGDNVYVDSRSTSIDRMVGTYHGALVDCQECDFSKAVTPDDGILPADVVVEHGRATGHKLSVGSVEE